MAKKTVHGKEKTETVPEKQEKPKSEDAGKIKGLKINPDGTTEWTVEDFLRGSVTFIRKRNDH